ncbi:MAG: 6-phosphogluconolactonase [Patescibacteria group bacterium]|nr:6-phosphogluconolactonase [Patescibacteria group bacterium]
MKENPQGKVFATFGMGSDGHTAGIFPLKSNGAEFDRLFSGQDWVVGYNNGGQKPPPERFTVTLSFFKLIDQAVVFISGQEKKPALEAVLKQTGKLNELPALGWQQIKSIEIFTDIS